MLFGCVENEFSSRNVTNGDDTASVISHLALGRIGTNRNTNPWQAKDASFRAIPNALRLPQRGFL